MGETSARAQPSVVTPGNYDGVHLGHRQLLATARAEAARGPASLRVVAMTFDPHPAHFMAKEGGGELLTEPSRRRELLLGLGADEVVIKRFDAAFAALTPDAFARTVLVGELGAHAVVVGEDFRFGTGRAGDVAMLHTLGAQLGFSVIDVAKVQCAGNAVSSSRIRRALADGDVTSAAQMLGRVHDVTRRVIRGDQRGRTIGVPTANLELAGTLLPQSGVYAVVVKVLGEPGANLRAGVANLGSRPTVAAGRSFEVHLLDFEGDLYDHELRVGFVERLREERKFPDLGALKQQIHRDIQAARSAIEATDAERLRWI
jgi:riboflavin kinase / FMN adenylyltransferase